MRAPKCLLWKTNNSFSNSYLQKTHGCSKSEGAWDLVFVRRMPPLRVGGGFGGAADKRAGKAPAAAQPAKRGRGGGGRGGGRKPTGVNTPGVDSVGAPKRKQTNLGELSFSASASSRSTSRVRRASLRTLVVSVRGCAQRSSRVSSRQQHMEVRPHPRRDRQRTRIASNQNRLSNTMFVYQYQYHSILIKKRPNTGMIPVNVPHWRGPSCSAVSPISVKKYAGVCRGRRGRGGPRARDPRCVSLHYQFGFIWIHR